MPWAYDPARQRVVLFGGVDPQASLGDTWVWDGTFWTQVADTGPIARSGHAMAYDISRSQVILFGGRTGSTSLDDTWAWDGVAWTQVAETGPSPRTDHAMACNDARGVIVLFGGTGDGERGDTWEWDGTAWTQREESGPGARRGHSMAYDTAIGRVVLFGGASQNQVLDDTWEWNGMLWRQVAEFGAPGGLDAAMTYAGRGSVLFGGVGSTTPGEAGRDSTWEWDGRFWTEIQHFGPPGRTEHSAVFDSARSRVVLYGGVRQSGSPSAASLLGDTWECPAREPVVTSVTVSPTEVRQGGTLAVTVRLSGPTADDLPVQLASSLSEQPASLDLPSTMTVAAGQAVASASAVLPLEAQSGTYTITASAGGISRSTSLVVSQVAPPGTLRIVAAMPSPEGDDTQNEQVHIRNEGGISVNLAGWRVANPQGNQWLLDNVDGAVAPAEVAIVMRQGRPMGLLNSGGTILLINPAGETLDTKSYGPASSGQVIQFD